ncbi:unnamed protein product [Auanema sp. JU1783]|nr:unnamed protein product [Auanema sp. JU1783]
MESVKASDEIKNYISQAVIRASQWTLPNGSTHENSDSIEVQRVGVIGGGTMGRGIALALVLAGYEAIIVEHTYEAVQACQKEVALTIKREVSLKRFKEKDVHRLKSNALMYTTDLNLLKDCQLIIEAIFENMNMKIELFQKLDKILPENAIFGTNTSSLNIDEMAKAIANPSRVVGIHFFNPPHVIKVVEIVFGSYTSGTAVATAFEVCQRMRKLAVLVGNCPSFVFNRLLAVYINQSMKLMYEYGLLPKDIDNIITSRGFLMGPITVVDMNGLDVAEKVKTEHNVPLNKLEIELLKQKRYGRKTGKGFYKYDEITKKKESDLEVEFLIQSVASSASPNISLYCDSDVYEFIIFPLINEGYLCLEEGMIEEEQLIDILFILGFGWPVNTGGPMHWAKEIGVKKIAEKLALWNNLNPTAREYKLSKTLRKNASMVCKL